MIERILHSQFDDDGERFFLIFLLADWIEKILCFSHALLSISAATTAAHTTNKSIRNREGKKNSNPIHAGEDRICCIWWGDCGHKQRLPIVWHSLGFGEKIIKEKKEQQQKKNQKNPSVDFDFSADTFHFIPALQLGWLLVFFFAPGLFFFFPHQESPRYTRWWMNFRRPSSAIEISQRTRRDVYENIWQNPKVLVLLLFFCWR